MLVVKSEDAFSVMHCERGSCVRREERKWREERENPKSRPAHITLFVYFVHMYIHWTNR
jgi:hypothetical protein